MGQKVLLLSWTFKTKKLLIPRVLSAILNIIELPFMASLFCGLLVKPIITIAVAFSFLAFLTSFPLRAEEIKDFHAEILVTKDGSISVQESIEYDFGYELRHGIFREIPYKYQVDVRNYNLRIDIRRVTDFNDKAYHYDVRTEGRYVIVKIGDPDTEISGVNQYRIEYFVERAVIFFEDHDELYWNITGNEWKIPIGRASAKIYFEDEVPDGIKATCYTGYFGSKGQECEFNVTTSGIEFVSSETLRPGQGLTIALGLPKGILKEPSPLKKASWFIADNWFFSLPFLTLLFITYYWHTRGRDPDGKGVIAVQYEPPRDLTPAEAGTLLDERADIVDITSTVIDLAVRGFIKIEEIQSKKFYFFSDRDYRLIRMKEPEVETIKPHERKVLAGIFGSKEEVMISSLENKFYTHLPSIKDSLYEELVSGGYFTSNPENIRRIFKWLGIGIAGLSLILVPHWGMKISLVLSGIFILIFSRYMPRKTKKGSMVKESILGFREFIQRAEKDRIERLAKDDPTLFDRVLPFALVFGLGDKWAQAFHDMYKTPPSWYDSPRYGTTFSPRIFVDDLGRSLSVMNSTFASAPSSSGGAGGSGFSGGSSGGGFGGGGGGSW